MKKKRVIVWFRQDLRLHDNEALTDALRHSLEVVPVYVFDERVFKGTSKYGFPKTGKFRAKFIIESVQDLRASLSALGSHLIVRVGKPEEVIFQLARELKTTWVFCNRERTDEEVQVQDKLEKKLWEIGQELRYSRGKMLYYTADLPFPVTHTPDVFTHFRKEVERLIPIREPLPAPVKNDFESLTVRIEEGNIPDLSDFGHEEVILEKRAAIHFKGGEKEGLKRLHHYLWDSEAIKYYKETRNELIGKDYSSKFSPWLAQGCLSPKIIYQEIKKFEKEKVKNKSTYFLIFELLWRDFFRLMGKKHGNAIFKKKGTSGKKNPPGIEDHQLLNIWIAGKTGIPFIDANMLELKKTGFMSNRGRQNVASFLVKDLNVNWQMGADYFESTLIDYDPCSNWGNWNYIAGIGSDPRENRYFNILKQASRYDPKGDYVKLWCPELQHIPNEKIHRPDLYAREKISPEKENPNYPLPIIDVGKWI